VTPEAGGQGSSVAGQDPPPLAQLAHHRFDTPRKILPLESEPNYLALTHVDATGIETLRDTILDLGRDRITFAFARLKEPMRAQLEHSGILAAVGKDHLYPTVRAGVDAAI
jgi:hypothetical protein